MHVYRHKHFKTRGVWGHAPSGNCFAIRCSEIASEAILGQKQGCIVAIVDQFQMVGDLNVQLSGVYKIFWRPKGGFE